MKDIIFIVLILFAFIMTIGVFIIMSYNLYCKITEKNYFKALLYASGAIMSVLLLIIEYDYIMLNG